MKVSDYIVSFLIEHNISDAFGYPGGMVTYLMDSFDKYKDKISIHLNYHEQGAAFAACGYAQTSKKVGCAYATSGSGATNLITGIGNAYFDSIPVLFLTGQVNTYEGKGDLRIRQKGFQEMDVISIVSSITKYSVCVTDANDIRYHLEKAFYLSTFGRPGPVLLDIPMNVQRTEIDLEKIKGFISPEERKNQYNAQAICSKIYESLSKAKRPCVIAGAGIASSGTGDLFAKWINKIKIPVVSSMPAIDVLPECPYYYGFIGAYGLRYANFILAKSDLIISLGSRLDLRQIGAKTDNFAVNAHLLRIDVDELEFTRKVKNNEEDFYANLKELMPELASAGIDMNSSYNTWLNICDKIENRLKLVDEQPANKIIRKISGLVDRGFVITTDVGQNQVWVAQSFIPRGQRVLFSSGHGAMGYSLPAAIGAYYGSGKKVISFNGDGGLQMNIQELQFIVRESLPVKIILLNNESLGMIRHFQEMYFDSNYVQTKKQRGYTTPNFGAIANAYGIAYCSIADISDINSIKPYLENDSPAFIEIVLSDETYILNFRTCKKSA